MGAGEAPGLRAGHGMGSDTTAKTVRLFGGDSEVGPEIDYTDVYTYNGATWLLQPSAGRNSVKGATMSYDGNANKLVTFGGLAGATPVQETWTWSASGGWVNANPVGKPPARDDTATAYDPVRRRTVV